MQTIEAPATETALNPEEWNEDGEFCIVDDNNPELALCGFRFAPWAQGLPDEEVPDEITCPECLAIQANKKSK